MITVGLIEEKDLGIVRDLAKEIFPRTYAQIIPAEQIEYMMEMMYSMPSLRRQLVDEKQVFHLVRFNGIPCGYFSLECKSVDTFILQKLYLLPSMQGKGVGRRMMDEAVSYIRREHPEVRNLQLYVNRENRATDFYLRYGFREIATRDQPVGNGYFMNDYIMELSLL